MPPTALGLLLVAATLHAGWNFLVKRAKEKQVFTWWGLVVGSLCFAPTFLFSPALPLRILPYALISGLVEAIYYVVLTRAYDYGDFSLVYPMARGSAPALLALWAVLFLGERPSPTGLAGLALLVLGLIIVGGNAWWSLRNASVLSTSSIILALGVALTISVYSVIDGAAVHLAAPAPYTVLVIGLSSVFITPALFMRYGRETIIAEWRTNWLRIIVVGLCMLLSYMLVLVTYSFARVSYAGAVREISVVFAAFLGWRWLGEGFGVLRTVGAVLIFAGIVVIAILG